MSEDLLFSLAKRVAELERRLAELELRQAPATYQPVYMPTPAFPRPVDRPYIGDPMPPPSIT